MVTRMFGDTLEHDAITDTWESHRKTLSWAPTFVRSMIVSIESVPDILE